MGRLTTWKCDECGAIKKEVNGWWVLELYSKELHLAPLPDGEIDLPRKGVQSLTLCGRACVQRRIAEFMGGTERG
jgi:hypothetical protein